MRGPVAWMSVAAGASAAALVAGSLVASPAGAADDVPGGVVVPGSALVVGVPGGASSGAVTARFSGTQSSLFSASETGLSADAAAHFALHVGGRAYSGISPTRFTQVSAPALSGTGTAADPWAVTSSFDAGTSGLRVTQVLTAVDGGTAYALSWSVRNGGAAPVGFQAFNAGDLYVSGFDEGFGELAGTAPARILSGVSPDGSRAELVEDATAPWEHYYEGDYVSYDDPFHSAGWGYPDSHEPTVVDHALGVQWSVPALAPGDTRTLAVGWRFVPPAAPLAPVVTGLPTGATAATSATASLARQPADTTLARYVCALDAAAPTPCSDPTTLPGLSRGAHALRVWGVNSAGVRGPATTRSWSVAAVPGAVTGLTARAADGGAAVTFTPPADDGGSAVTGYESSLDGGTTWAALPTAPAGGGTRTGTTAGPGDATALSVSVRAVNAIGPGPASAPAALSPLTLVPPPPAPAGAPLAPAVAATAGTSAVFASWAPASGASAVTGYRAYASPGPASCSTSGRRCVLGGTAGSAYTVTVVASFADGTTAAGVPSAPVVAGDPVLPPAAPVTGDALGTDRGPVGVALPGAALTLTGEGFLPHSTAKVGVYPGPTVLGSVTADGDGRLAAPVEVPAGIEPGDHVLVAVGVGPDGAGRTARLPVVVVPPVLRSSGPGAQPQAVSLPVPPGGSVTLLDGAGRPTTVVDVAREGGYALDAPTGALTFLPATGFSGAPRPVGYRVVDAVGTAATGAYHPFVTSAAAVPLTSEEPGRVRLPLPARIVHDGVVRLPCTSSRPDLRRCAVTVSTVVAGRRVVVGAGTATAARGTRRVDVGVRLTPLGRAVTAVPGGVPFRVTASVSRTGQPRPRPAAGAATVVARSFKLARAAYFPTESARVSAADARYLAAVRARLDGARVVSCLGYTDSRGSWESGVTLGRRRARVVCAALTEGVPVRARVVTMGERDPYASNATPAGRALNRRTDIWLRY
ncbi:OmpA family protein [Motilibacter aurantiacus]|uniref:OmpA family protein n=1 Tax=Motilibacter aurantiacus TaxID=2714955 RepID=UPI00140A35BD|nr:OmpA family protein [Motilibacter aurantiacus]NHC45711.1 hypothetical protein [Motilibacter aurantiacus]